MNPAPAMCPLTENKSFGKKGLHMDLSIFKTRESSKGIEVSENKRCNPFILKNTSYYPELAQLVEILKVEGSWVKRGALSICSKSPELISCFSNLFDSLSIIYSISYRLKIKLPIEYSDIETIKLFENGSEKAFNFEKNVFKGKIDKIAFSTKSKSGESVLKINGEDHKFHFSIHDDFFESSNGLYVYSEVRANNKSFVTFLEKTLLEKSGSHEIRISKFLKESNHGIIVKVFASVIDCEGSIRYSGLTRNIRLRMYNDSYLNDWKELLAQIGVTSHFSSGQLTITNNQNFQRLADLGFELVHNAKKQRFESMLKNYQKRQILRGSSAEFYIEKLKGLNRKVSALELSNLLNKNKRVVSHYLLILEKSNKISVDKSPPKFLYSVES